MSLPCRLSPVCEGGVERTSGWDDVALGRHVTVRRPGASAMPLRWPVCTSDGARRSRTSRGARAPAAESGCPRTAAGRDRPRSGGPAGRDEEVRHELAHWVLLDHACRVVPDVRCRSSGRRRAAAQLIATPTRSPHQPGRHHERALSAGSRATRRVAHRCDRGLIGRRNAGFGTVMNSRCRQPVLRRGRSCLSDRHQSCSPRPRPSPGCSASPRRQGSAPSRATPSARVPLLQTAGLPLYFVLRTGRDLDAAVGRRALSRRPTASRFGILLCKNIQRPPMWTAPAAATHPGAHRVVRGTDVRRAVPTRVAVHSPAPPGRPPSKDAAGAARATQGMRTTTTPSHRRARLHRLATTRRTPRGRATSTPTPTTTSWASSSQRSWPTSRSCRSERGASAASATVSPVPRRAIRRHHRVAAPMRGTPRSSHERATEPGRGGCEPHGEDVNGLQAFAD